MLKPIILFCLLCFSNLFAQSKATIVGNVKSFENENLIGVRISLDTNSQHYNYVSDTLGSFTAELPSGFVKIAVNYFGYLKKTLSFDCKNDTIISIILEKDVSFLEEVVISNNKRSSMTNLSGGKLSFNSMVK